MPAFADSIQDYRSLDALQRLLRMAIAHPLPPIIVFVVGNEPFELKLLRVLGLPLRHDRRPCMAIRHGMLLVVPL